MPVDLEDERFEGMMKADGLDDALVGIASVPGRGDVLAYDVAKVIQILIDRDGMDHDEATEFFDFNISSTYVGEGTPIWIHTLEMLE